ncbi:hypothetical protein [Konateibacter massiliensis]|uniref:hypothetical protein n=1 Tax=Konateibacter massiliensis TaxID=2002841 RepID=UPI000C15CD82|nr:hypothetical protein [Konateibacter massiliensis]
MNFKEKFQIEKEKLSKMKFKDKVGYIWEYYKYWIIGTIAGIILIYGIVDAQIENSKPTYLYLTLVNTNLMSSNETTLMDDFAAYAQLDLSDTRLNMDTSIQMDPEVSDEYSMNSSAKMFAQFASKTIDATIMDKDMVNFFADVDAFADLSEVLPADFYEAHKDNFITGTDSEGNKFICAIDISDSVIFQRTNAYQVTPYYSIVANTENLDNTIEFLQYLYSENK